MGEETEEIRYLSDKELEEYQKILHELYTRCMVLNTKKYSLDQAIRTHEASISRFIDLLPVIFKFFPVLPSGARLSPIRWVAFGGECIVAKASNSQSFEKYAVRIGWKGFNEPDIIRRVEDERAENKTEVIRNEWRLRFIRGLEKQDEFRDLGRELLEAGRVQQVVTFTRQAPIIGVLKWIDGKNLADYKFSQESNISQITFIFWRFCNLIKLLHENRIVHRDLSPKNIIIDKYNCPWLTDWTVVKDLISSEILTRPGETYLGNNLYAAPEQIYSGNAHLATYKSDVFSLGWILYFITVGQDPPRDITLRRLRRRETSKIPYCFRDLFYDATRENIDERPDIEDFIKQYVLACRGEGISFEEILAKYIKPNKITGFGGLTEIEVTSERLPVKDIELRFSNIETRLKAIEDKLISLRNRLLGE